MSFLRRLRGDGTPSEPGVWATSPEWAAPITARDFEFVARLVQKELGRERIPDPALLRDFADAAELSLPNLVPLLVTIPTEQWPAYLHTMLERTRESRAAGDALEARSQTLEAATPVLRIHWMPRAAAPLGDVTVEGPVPDTVEVLALDTGPSLRHVSERLLGRWDVGVDEAVRVGRPHARPWSD
jgi:hypothetical protein